MEKVTSSNKISSVTDALIHLKKGIDFTREHVVLIGVNTKHDVVFSKIMFVGGINACVLDLRVLFRELLLHSCHGFIVGHNHPSEDLRASKEDLEIFGRIRALAKEFEFQFVDNIIFSEKEYISFLNEGVIG